ncbi:MAG: antibiotic biosynthesis monooxygenase [Actinomycetota bacterium]
MDVVEIARFRLLPETDPAAFAAANDRVTTAYISAQPGYLGSRETASNADGVWVVIVKWASIEAAEASMAKFMGDPATQDFVAGMDAESLTMERFTLTG